MQRVDVAWEALGVNGHAGEAVDGERNVEFQCSTVHARHHWLGVAGIKRVCLISMMLRVLSEPLLWR
jgi:hypothetical protein